jgi:hypothetical protein
VAPASREWASSLLSLRWLARARLIMTVEAPVEGPSGHDNGRFG